jgi:hypothetical protein
MAKKQIPCPYCSAEEKVLSEQNGRAARSASLWPKFQNIVFAISDLLSLITGNTKEVSRRDVVGDCKACNNRRTFDDPSDSTDAEKIAFDIIDKEKDFLLKESMKLGSSPGGSRLTRVAGAEVLIVGHKLNTAESVGIRGDAPIATQGCVGVKPEGRAGVMKGDKKGPAVKCFNVPANSGGGQYIIQCGNKFNLVAGSQGAHIETYGPLNLHGKAGVQITGAEVTIGGGQGQTAIGGKHINVEGEYISLAPSGESGHVNVMGSLEATGNVKAGGAYFDTVYFSKGVCPSKQVPVKGGSTTTIQTGPALWGGTNIAAVKAALQQLQKSVEERTLDPDLFKAGGPTTPRFFFNLADLMYGITYAALSIELKITGICFTLVGPGLVFNFPHTHSLHDGLHTHQVEVPALNYEGYSSSSLVKAAANAAGVNTKVPCAGSTGENIFVQAWTKITNVYNAFAGKSAVESSHEKMTA